jgi:glycosyltransferase involved in cell wall biosynthesis
MKIGINASFLRKPGTGIGQVTFNFLEKLKEFPISNFQFPNGDSVEFFIYTEIPFSADNYPKNFRFKNFLPLWKRDDLIRKILWEKQVAKEAVKDGCEAFLSLYQSSTTFSQQLTVNKKPIRHTMFVHDIIPKLYPHYRGNMRQALHWYTVEQGIRRADHIIAISEHTKNDIIRELDVPKEKISVVSPDVNARFSEPVKPERMAAVLKKYALTPGYIYHGGGLEVRKNTETLLRAYKQLTRLPARQAVSNKQSAIKIPELVISGKIYARTNKLATDVAGLVEELHLQNRVKLLGFVPDEDLPALYAGALFFVYPSLYEGFGLPVLEALRMHVPVLSSDASSLPEVGGTAVLYTSPKDIELMATQMERLIRDRALRENLISQSASQALQFSWEQCVRKVLALVIQ